MLDRGYTRIWVDCKGFESWVVVQLPVCPSYARSPYFLKLVNALVNLLAIRRSLTHLGSMELRGRSFVTYSDSQLILDIGTTGGR